MTGLGPFRRCVGRYCSTTASWRPRWLTLPNPFASPPPSPQQAEVGMSMYSAYLRRTARYTTLWTTRWWSYGFSLPAHLQLVALTSKNEGTPASLIEAQAAGLPVIATDVGGVQDIVHHEKGGFIVEPNNRDAFVHALINLLDNVHLRQAMGSYGRRFVFNLYDKKVLLKNTDELYKLI